MVQGSSVKPNWRSYRLYKDLLRTNATDRITDIPIRYEWGGTMFPCMKEYHAWYVPILVCTRLVFYFLAQLVSARLVVVPLRLHVSVAKRFRRQVGHWILVMREAENREFPRKSLSEIIRKGLVPNPWSLE